MVRKAIRTFQNLVCEYLFTFVSALILWTEFWSVVMVGTIVTYLRPLLFLRPCGGTKLFGRMSDTLLSPCQAQLS